MPDDPKTFRAVEAHTVDDLEEKLNELPNTYEIVQITPRRTHGPIGDIDVLVAVLRHSLT